MNDVNVFTAVNRTFQLSGRSTRREYWYYTGMLALIAFSIGMYTVNDSSSDYYLDLFFIVTLPTTVCVNTRRLHDIDKSGWWQFVLLIPIVGFILYIIWWTRDGIRGENKYGLDPKGRDIIV